MAIGKALESREAGEIKRYIGVAPCFVLALNPTKAELEKFYGAEIKAEPVYVSEKEGVKSVRLDFVVKTDSEKCGVELITKHSYWLRNQPMTNRDNTKVKVIDKYGNTAWVTQDEFKNKVVPIQSNGKSARITADYRVCMRGEEEVTAFLRNYLNIEESFEYVNEAWVLKKNNLDDCECRIDDINALFGGNFKEMQTYVAMMPNNKVKIMFGVQHSDNGDYQATYPTVLKNSSSNYSRLDKDYQEAKSRGSYATTEFRCSDIEEYKVVATPLEATPSDLPFESSPWA